MENRHSCAVNTMLDVIIPTSQSTKFSFIDIGCGNGWVVRKINQNPFCRRSIGIDGAKEMIKKAKNIDPFGEYICSDILDWFPNETVDFVHGMEVIYYFNRPEKLIDHITENWIKPGGKIIMGLDYYMENQNSHSWPNDLNTQMKLLNIDGWLKLFKSCKLDFVDTFQTNSNENFPGTLVIHGTKCI